MLRHSLELSCSLQVVLWRHLLWRKHLIIEYDGVALAVFWVFACSMITIIFFMLFFDCFLSPSFSVGSSFIVYFFNTYFREESEACGEQICDRELHQEVVHSRELKRFIIHNCLIVSFWKGLSFTIILFFTFEKDYHLQRSYCLLFKRLIICNYHIVHFLKASSFAIIFFFAF